MHTYYLTINFQNVIILTVEIMVLCIDFKLFKETFQKKIYMRWGIFSGIYLS